MYKYVEDKQFLSRMRSLCGEIMQDLCHTLKEEYDIGASFYLVGSGARNLILQNANQPIDLDYNLEITRIDDWEDCKEIKECVRKAFNIVLREYGWSDCQDSTSSLTTEKRHFNQGKWTLVREQYLKIKKQYLTSNDYNHSSFICYIEAVNNVYNSRKHWN